MWPLMMDVEPLQQPGLGPYLALVNTMVVDSFQTLHSRQLNESNPKHGACF